MQSNQRQHRPDAIIMAIACIRRHATGRMRGHVSTVQAEVPLAVGNNVRYAASAFDHYTFP